MIFDLYSMYAANRQIQPSVCAMDEIDKKILASLQSDARRKNADLAKELSLAPSSMLARVRRLEANGFIKSYTAMLNPERLGLSVQALISVCLSEHTSGTIRPFEAAAKQIPYVLACYNVTGRFDYILHVVARNLDHLGSVVKEHIAAIEGVGRTETFVIFSEIKAYRGVPLYDGEGRDGIRS